MIIIDPNPGPGLLGRNTNTCSVLQIQKKVIAYLRREQLLLFDFAR